MKAKLILLFMLVSFLANAQWGVSKKEDVDAVKSRTLIVVVEEPNSNLLKNLNADDQQVYKQDIENYNNSMKVLVPKYWKWNVKIEFKTRTEVTALVKSKSKLYAYIEHNKFLVNYANKTAFGITQKIKTGDVPLVGADYAETALVVRLTDQNPLGNPVYGIYIPAAFPTDAQLVYGLKQLQLQFKYKSQGLKDVAILGLFKDNAKLLAQKILLIDNLTIEFNDSDIKKIYPYPYKIVSRAVIEKAILDNDPNFVAIYFIPRVSGVVSTFVFDTNEGLEMARTSNDYNTGVSVSTVQIDAIKTQSTKGTVRKDDLKIIAKQVK